MNQFNADVLLNRGFSRVIAIVVALETFRKPSKSNPLPPIDYAHADGDSIAITLREIYGDMAEEDVSIHVLKDADASLTALREDLYDTIAGLEKDALFVFYYTGHGFHTAQGNRLCAYDTNPQSIKRTTLSLQDDLIGPLMDSKCKQAFLFIDASAQPAKAVAQGEDTFSNLDAGEIHAAIQSSGRCSAFLSCALDEHTYASSQLKHGIWAHFLIEALSGRAPKALTADLWLTDVGLQTHLSFEVPRFITQALKVKGSQTPQAILSSNDAVPIHHMPLPESASQDMALAGITLQNNSEFLEGTETGVIRRLPGVTRGFSKAPTSASASVNSWCQRLLAERVSEELQNLYQTSRKALNARRKDVQKAEDTGFADLDTAAFRYSIETGQNPEDPTEFFIRRRLELRQDWDVHRSAINEIFGSEFDCLVVEFEQMDDTFDDLVDKLEDIQYSHGGEITDDDQTQRATLIRNGVTYAFDLKRRRLEISFGRVGALKLIDAAQDIQLGISRPSPMLGS